jgi:hypothetical protein
MYPDVDVLKKKSKLASKTRSRRPLPFLPFAFPLSLTRSQNRMVRSLPQLLELLEEYKHEHCVGPAMW